MKRFELTGFAFAPAMQRLASPSATATVRERRRTQYKAEQHSTDYCTSIFVDFVRGFGAEPMEYQYTVRYNMASLPKPL